MEIDQAKHLLSLTQMGGYCFLGLISSTITTWCMRVLALQNNILDIPNDRSSHSIPTPRSGGLAIVLIFLISVISLAANRLLDQALMWSLVPGGIVVAAMGYYDDLYKIKIPLRIIIQFLIAMWAIYWLNGFPILELGHFKLTLGLPGSLLAVITIVWFINFYNFMDGIDGLAGLEGIYVSIVSGFALWWIGDATLAFLLSLLAVSIIGFMLWNWPPAKIFLGDVGSGFLGYVFAVLTFYTAKKGLLPIAFWYILLSVFILDATFTLIMRIIQGKPWYLAHKEHAYQQLIAFGLSHKKVTIMILLLNMLILMPIAFLLFYLPQTTLWLLTSTTMALFFIWSLVKVLRRL